MTDYFTADLHFHHRKVAEIRGFDSVDEHDRNIYFALADRLKPGDRLWVLGDVSGGYAEWDAVQLLYALVMESGAELHLIAGNHDSVHPMHRHSERAQEIFGVAFTSIDSMGTFRHRRKKVMLSHFPFAGDRGVDRYPEYRLRDCGLPIVHGHTHQPEPVSFSPAGTLQVCVSLDSWGLKPVSKEAITALIDTHQEVGDGRG